MRYRSLNGKRLKPASQYKVVEARDRVASSSSNRAHIRRLGTPAGLKLITRPRCAKYNNKASSCRPSCGHLDIPVGGEEDGAIGIEGAAAVGTQVYSVLKGFECRKGGR